MCNFSCAFSPWWNLFPYFCPLIFTDFWEIYGFSCSWFNGSIILRWTLQMTSMKVRMKEQGRWHQWSLILLLLGFLNSFSELRVCLNSVLLRVAYGSKVALYFNINLYMASQLVGLSTPSINISSVRVADANVPGMAVNWMHERRTN